MPSLASAQIKNGGFEKWPDDGNTESWAESWNADVVQIRAPGLTPESKSSAIIRDKHFLTQRFTPTNPRDFQLKFTVAVLESEIEGFEQPFIIALQTKSPKGDLIPWIQLRFDRDGGAAPLRLRLRGESDWGESLRGVIVSPTAYDTTTNKFTRLRPYDIVVTYSGTTETFSVSVGAPGKKAVVNSGLKEVQVKSAPSGINGLFFYAYNQGFAIDNISITSPAPKN